MIGVLLVNLGTPLSSKPKDVRRYLNEFLSDGRVLDFSWLKRNFLSRCLITPFRYKQSAEQYQQVWTSKGSPLLTHGIDVQHKLQESLGVNYKIALAMRYQSPSIKEGLEILKKASVNEIIILPLFPQYASATTGSVHQKVMDHIKHWQVIPKMTFINSYPTDSKFIDALCARAKQYDLDRYDHILFSYHGLPERHIRKADALSHCLSNDCCKTLTIKNQHCYKAQCYATTFAMARQLGFKQDKFSICFQSRLGKDPWLQPYASDAIENCAKSGNKNLLVFSPAFVCDCLETTFEIGHEYAKEFKNLGGESLQLVESLNSSPLWIEALHSIVINHSAGQKPAECMRLLTI